MKATVREVMRAPVETIDVQATLQEAAQKMRDLGIGFLPITEEGRLIGVVTDRDIATRGVAAGVPSRSTHVREVATMELVTCRPDQSLAFAEGLMAQRLVRRLVVVDGDMQPVGLVTLDDIARVRGAEAEAGRVLEQINLPDAQA